MRSAFGTLAARQVSRLLANRSVAVGLVLGLATLVLGGLGVWVVGQAQGGTWPEKIRVLAWTRGSGPYAVLVFVLAIVMGSLQVSADLRSGTLLSVLARPVSRARVFLAGWAGSALVLLAMETIRGSLGTGAVLLVGGTMDGPGLLALWADLLSTLLLLSLSAALGAFLSAGLASTACILVLILPAVAYSENIPGVSWLRPLCWLLPVLRTQDESIVRTLVGNGGETAIVAEAAAYRLCWIGVLLVLGAWGFSRRDLSPK